MPEPEKTSRSSNGLNELAAQAQRYVEVLSKTRKGTIENTAALNGLAGLMETWSPKVKRTTAEMLIFGDVLKSVEGKSRASGQTISAMADRYEAATGIMSDSSREVLQRQIESAKRAESIAKSSKGSEAALAILSSKRRQMEIQNFHDGLKRNAELAKNQVESGQRIRGIYNGLSTMLSLRGSEGAEKVGGFLGVSGNSMAGMAKSFGVIGLAAYALNAAIGTTAKNMLDSAAAGNNQSDSLGGAAKSSEAYTRALFAATAQTGLSRDVLVEYTQAIYQQYGRSAEFGALFAGELANVGATFGISGKEAVDFSAKLASASRSNAIGVQRMFEATGRSASRLGVPMQMLMDPMLEIADIAGRTGQNAVQAAGQLESLVGTIQSLGAQGDNTMKMFKNMSPTQIAKMTSQFSGMIAKISDLSLAAFTFGKYKNLGGMVKGVVEMTPQGRLDAMRGLMNAYGMGDSSRLSESERYDRRYRLGIMLGANPEDMAGAVARGAMVQASNRKNGAQVEQSYINTLDAELRSRKTAGEVMAFGTDPTMKVIQLMTDAVRYLSQIAGSRMVNLLAGGGEPAAEEQTSPNVAGGYGATAVRRVGHSGPALVLGTR